jgi:D-apiose dehydrogenase
MNRPIKIAICGTGFWSNYQIPGWLEIPGIEITALYNRTVSRAEEVAKRFGIARVYGNIDELLERETIDALDIITDVNTHAVFARKAAQRKVHVISQKPMAPDLLTARSMLDTCSAHGVQLFVHENFRWQSPIRAIKKVLEILDQILFWFPGI